MFKDNLWRSVLRQHRQLLLNNSAEDDPAPASSAVVGKHSVEVGSSATFSDAVPDICRPIQCRVIEREQANMSGSTSGIDRVKFLEVKQLSNETLCVHYNFGYIMSVCHPSEMKKSRIIPILKIDDASALEHPPISICSHISQLFHKILTARLDTEVSFLLALRGSGRFMG